MKLVLRFFLPIFLAYFVFGFIFSVLIYSTNVPDNYPVVVFPTKY